MSCNTVLVEMCVAMRIALGKLQIKHSAPCNNQQSGALLTALFSHSRYRNQSKICLMQSLHRLTSRGQMYVHSSVHTPSAARCVNRSASPVHGWKRITGETNILPLASSILRGCRWKIFLRATINYGCVNIPIHDTNAASEFLVYKLYEAVYKRSVHSCPG